MANDKPVQKTLADFTGTKDEILRAKVDTIARFGYAAWAEIVKNSRPQK